MRQSNIFATNGFNGGYVVSIRQVDLLVKFQFSPDALSLWVYVLMCGCCLCLLVIILLGVILFVLSARNTASKQ